MKKIVFSFITLFTSLCGYSQSVSITPTGDEVLITRAGTVPNLAGRRSEGTSAAPIATGAGSHLMVEVILVLLGLQM
jgi:hypothetical protein